MRKVAILLAIMAALLASTPMAVASTPRHDTYYEVWCTDGEGNLVQAESIDVHAIEVGGKGHAIDLFSNNYPFDYDCWPEGPITS
jgi:hypothetical protein